MKTHLRLTGLVLSLTLAGCAAALTQTQRQLAGTWEDEGGAVTTIVEQSGQLVVASVIDTDGEVFQLRGFGWDGDVYWWRYFVPSTEYTVMTRVLEIGRDELQTEWSNDQGGSGPEVYVRLER